MKLDEISRSETLRYMGHRGEVPAELEKILDESEKLIKTSVFPKYTYRISDIAEDDNKIRITGFTPIESNSLREHLKGCKKAVIMAVTLTAEADRLISRAEVRDMTEAYVLDAMCSSAIETACDMAEREIFSEIGAEYTTWRYSAGYGDFALSHQQDFIKYLNTEKRIGLTLTPEFLMIPRKSVTAIIGISDNPVENKRKSCQFCNMRGRCRFSLNGTHC